MNTQPFAHFAAGQLTDAHQRISSEYARVAERFAQITEALLADTIKRVAPQAVRVTFTSEGYENGTFLVIDRVLAADGADLDDSILDEILSEGEVDMMLADITALRGCFLDALNLDGC
jgi:hypothetical protein